MDVLHSRVAPSAEHTLDDLVFAAFQGPVLSLSSRVLHRHRSFAALLLLRSRWRTDRGLSPADVADALLGARCCMPETLAPAECERCGGVLDVAENVAEQWRLSRDLPCDIELYAVAVRTRCTSSRTHVGCATLVLAVDLAPGTVVVSDRFAISTLDDDLVFLNENDWRVFNTYLPCDIELYAVAVRTRCTSSRTHVGCATLVLAVDLAPGTVVVSDRFAVYARPAGRQLVPRRTVDGTGASRSVALGCELLGDGDKSAAAESRLCLAGPALPLAFQSQGEQQPMAIAVCLSAVKVSEEEQRQVTWGLMALLRSNVPGFLMQKASMHESFIVFIVGFCSAGSMALASRFGVPFFCNEIRNPLNRNLIADGLLQPLVCTSNTP
eukprot:m51a1_g6191 hypothetical protein (382) ;mRNA; r:66750-70929